MALGLFSRKQWTGGLYFGRAAWHPAPLELATKTPAAGTVPKDPAELARLLEDAGMAVTSPVSPSLAAQLRDVATVAGGAKGRSQIRAAVLNLLPTQPESALPAALIRDAADDVLAGLLAACEAISPRRMIAVVDTHDYKMTKLLREAIKRNKGLAGITVTRVLNTYPRAHPTLLVRSLFGAKLPPESLPNRVHRVIIDPVAAWALGRLARGGELPKDRPVQIFEDCKSPRLVLARVGMKVDELLIREKVEIAGQQVIRNGMLLGEEIDAGQTVIDWRTEMLAVRGQPILELSNPCISCGWCVDHCPTALAPVRLYEQSLMAANHRRGESLEARHCIGCGLCSYVCPTRLPLAAQVVRLRTELAETPAIPAQGPEEEAGDE